MPILNAGQLTLADFSKRLSPDGKIDPVAELLSQQNLILEDLVMVEAAHLVPWGESRDDIIMHRFRKPTACHSVLW